MRRAYVGLGVVALIGGVAAIVLQITGRGAPSSEGACFAYFFGSVLLLCGLILTRGAPEAQPAPARPLPEPGPEVEALVREGDLIGAIKRYRELHHVGLKDAKDAVDAIRSRIP